MFKEKHRHIIIFTMTWGTFEYLRISFGLINVAVAFQRDVGCSQSDCKMILNFKWLKPLRVRV